MQLTATSIVSIHRLFGSKEKSLPQEEINARKEEENLFSELPQVPALLSNVTKVMENEQGTKQSPSKKKRKTK